MSGNLKLPVGIDDFRKIRECGFYYVDKTLFDGLYISQNKELCDMHMGKYPVISITLKGIEGMTFEEARNMLKIILKNEARRHYYLKNSDRLTDDDKQQYEQILLGKAENIARGMLSIM